MDAEVFGCATRVQPLGAVIARRATKMLNHSGSHASHELVGWAVENRESGPGASAKGIRGGPSVARVVTPRKPGSAEGVGKRIAQSGRWRRLRCRDPLTVSARPRGCSSTAGAGL